MMLTSVETSVFACCDLGRSGLIMAIRCKGQCIWARTTGKDIGIGRGSTNFELVLVAGCILVGLAVAVGTKVCKFHEIAKWHLKLQCNYTEITLQLKLHKLSLAEAAAALPPSIR